VLPHSPLDTASELRKWNICPVTDVMMWSKDELVLDSCGRKRRVSTQDAAWDTYDLYLSHIFIYHISLFYWDDAVPVRIFLSANHLKCSGSIFKLYFKYCLFCSLK
jgi:hypothetical protein